jgi:D-sedoheptulose 7-phosphate isomerase
MLLEMIHEHIKCFQNLSVIEKEITHSAGQLAEAIRSGNKILICGNGGSAADAQHFAAEIVGRFQKKRRAWPAISLSTDTSILTAVGNDYSFANIFSRQVEGLARQGDILVGISTSGNSPNVVNAITTAKGLGAKTIGLLGGDGGKLREQADLVVLVPSANPARIQETHIFVLHYWAEFIESCLTGEVS